MEIVNAKLSDLNDIMDLYDISREIMRKNGNKNQWINGYPQREMIEEDIKRKESFLCMENHEIAGVFTLIYGDDPTYSYIEGGQWLNDKPYATIHRLGGSGKYKGVGQFCIEWSLKKYGNIRADTHADNYIMQNLLKKLEFQKCGVIYVQDGTPRIAYQKIIT